MSHRAEIVAAALLFVALSSHALSLGDMQGTAQVGRPLDLMVPVQLDAGQSASSSCFEADVFHASRRLDASRVRLLMESGAQSTTAQLRILSSAPIDEPVVTVNVRTVCGLQTSRQYVLLVDLPTASTASAAPSVPLVVPVTTRATGTAAVDKVPATPIPQRNTRPKAATPSPAEPVSRVAPGGAASTVPVTGRSRLTLDPLEFLSDRISALELDAPLANPDDGLQDKQTIQALEESVTTLKASAAISAVSLADLRARLQKAESTRFSAPLVYGLVALLLACLAALAWLWQRQHQLQARGGDWWGAAGTTPARPGLLARSPAESDELDLPRQSETEDVAAVADAAPDSEISSAVDVRLMDMSDSFFHGLSPSDESDSAKQRRPETPAPAPAKIHPAGLARDLHSEALLDIRQQAEFFVSLGQPEQAVHILKRHLQESEEPNPFIYLDLLGILHALRQKTDFQHLRADFNRLFKGRVPEFSLFAAAGQALEAYPDLLARVTALWSTPQALALLENELFADSPDSPPQSIDLAAFRDLLLLHSVAHGVAQESSASDGEAEPSSSRDVVRAAPVPPQPNPEHAGALDLDLSASHSESSASPAQEPAGFPRLSPEYASAATRRSSDNLIDFVLPVSPGTGPSEQKKPGPL